LRGGFLRDKPPIFVERRRVRFHVQPAGDAEARGEEYVAGDPLHQVLDRHQSSKLQDLLATESVHPGKIPAMRASEEHAPA
jgi:hypothetical protein